MKPAKNVLQEYCQKAGLPLPVYTTTSVSDGTNLRFVSEVVFQFNDGQIVTTSSPKKSKKEAEAETAEMAWYELDRLQEQKETALKTFLETNRKRANVIQKVVDQPIQVSQHTPPTQSTQSTQHTNSAQPTQPTNSTQPTQPTQPTLSKNQRRKLKKASSQSTTTTATKLVHLIDLENVPYHNKELDDTTLYIGIIGSVQSTVGKYSAWYRPKTRDFTTESLVSNKLLYTVSGGQKDLVDHFLSMFTVSVAEYVKHLDAPTTVYIISSDNATWCTRECLRMESMYQGIEHILTIENGRHI